MLLYFGLPKMLAAAVVLLGDVSWLFYTVIFHACYGQTVGKMVTRVRVVDFLTEGAISWRQAWLREGIPMALSVGLIACEVYLVLTGEVSQRDLADGRAFANGPFLLLDLLPSVWFIAEVVTMMTNDKRRALHDLIAGTVVIRTNTEEALPIEQGAGPAL